MPLADRPITLLLTSGPREFLSDDRDAATLLGISNNVVSIRIPGVSTTLCDLGFSPREYDLPGLPAGNYRIDLTFYDVEQPGDLGQPAGYIGGRDIIVLSSPAVLAIPSYGLPSLIAFGVLSLLAGLCAIGFRR